MTFGARHTSRAYEAELQELKEATVAMGDLCRQALGTALDAFHGGSHLAERVQEFDRESMRARSPSTRSSYASWRCGSRSLPISGSSR